MFRISSLVALGASVAVVCGCLVHQATVPSADPPISKSPLTAIALHVGMKREAVEFRISQLLKRKFLYNRFTQGQESHVVYRDEETHLEIDYRPAGISFWLQQPDGPTVHVHGSDAEVLAWTLHRQ